MVTLKKNQYVGPEGVALEAHGGNRGRKGIGHIVFAIERNFKTRQRRTRENARHRRMTTIPLRRANEVGKPNAI